MSYIVSNNKNCLNTLALQNLIVPLGGWNVMLRSKAKYIMPPVADWWPLPFKAKLNGYFSYRHIRKKSHELCLNFKLQTIFIVETLNFEQK